MKKLLIGLGFGCLFSLLPTLPALADTELQIHYRFSSDGSIVFHPLSLDYDVLLIGQKEYTLNVDFGKTDVRPPTGIDTKPEFYIESDNPEIVEKAKELTKDLKQPSDKVKTLSDFIYKKTTYTVKPLIQSNLGALHAFTMGAGDCEDYSDLLVAMARSVGLPARPVLGTYVSDTGKATFHQWAEVWYNQKWNQVDPLISFHFDPNSETFENCFSVTPEHYVALNFGETGMNPNWDVNGSTISDLEFTTIPSR